MTTPIGPPKLAPDDVPRAAAHYLDNAAVYLKDVAKQEKLELKPYDTHQPGQSRWLHGMYGTAKDREFCIQVITDDQMATEFRAHVYGWVRLYPRNGKNEWVHLLDNTVAGMEQLVRLAAEAAKLMRIVCVLSMPHPKRPDPKA